MTAGDIVSERPGVPDGEMIMGIRPEALRAAFHGGPTIEFEVDVVEPLGDEVLVHGTVAGETAEGEQATEEERLLAHVSSRAVMTARLEPTQRPRPGSRVEMGFDSEAVHLFDAATGLALN